jgi:hypothetical protein
MLNTQEHTDLVTQFERDCKPGRLDKEPRASWARGIIYQSGEVNALFLVYRHGYAFGKALWRPTDDPLAATRPATPHREPDR